MSRPGARVATVPAAHEPPPPRGTAQGGRHRALRITLFVAGLAVLGAILATVGWKSVAANLALIGGWFAGLVALYALAQLAFALGWWVLTGPAPRPMSFGALFTAYLGGDSINYFTGIGGEPVKAHLLGGKMGFGPAFATVWVHRNADVLAQWLFLFAGAVVTLTHFQLPPLARYLVVAGLLLLGGLALGFTTMQRRGFFGPILRQLLRIRPLASRLRHLEEDAHRLDEKIRLYYHAEEHRGQFALAVAWGVLGWCGGLVETWIVLRLLSPHNTFASAFAIEALAMILNSILFFIPGKIGSAEGIRLGVAALVGLAPAQGAAYALVRRARELIWLTPGIVVLLKHHLVDLGHLRMEKLDLSEDVPR